MMKVVDGFVELVCEETVFGSSTNPVDTIFFEFDFERGVGVGLDYLGACVIAVAGGIEVCRGGLCDQSDRGGACGLLGFAC